MPRSGCGRSKRPAQGYSTGGVAAYEAARLLEGRGHEVESLVLLDTPFPRYAAGAYRALRLLRRLLALTGWLPERLRAGQWWAKASDVALMTQLAAVCEYVPAPIAGRIVYVVPRVASLESASPGRDLQAWWSLLGRSVETVRAPGTHTSMIRGAQAARLATLLAAQLDPAEWVEDWSRDAAFS